LAPTQVVVLPVSDDQADYAYDIKDKLFADGVRVEVDDSNEQLGYKIRQAQLEKIPYMLIVGSREAEEGTVSVRDRDEGDLGAVEFVEFKDKILKEIENKVK
ncbi:MAG TPA: His/Gly/Thr/Pro-type tRNA ligase C-terminal domain-containing protein, partial [Halanaerobiales bacterium]|nr:His/Gly/Thr/Pro-type tRNA ligase C-terminal domain-containing protein [Halanaerobiales bacterium]